MRQKRILLSRPDRIGDVVLSTAIPREIKNKFPDAFVAVLLKSYTKDIYENNPYVDEIITDDFDETNKRQTFFSLIKKLRKYKFSHALMLLPTERHNWMFFFAGILIRVGVGHKFYMAITFAKSVSRRKYNPLRSEADFCMDLARKIGVDSDNFNPEIHLTAQEVIEKNELRNRLLDDKKLLIGVHLTSGNSAPNWKQDQYIKLIELLSSIKEIQIVITDNKISDKLVNTMNAVTPNIGSTLRQSIKTIGTLDYFFSASTGPMHLASALGINTISLFCPLTACSPVLWGPLGNKSENLIPSESYCKTKCPGDPKLCSYEGNDSITPNDVFKIILKKLNYAS